MSLCISTSPWFSPGLGPTGNLCGAGVGSGDGEGVKLRRTTETFLGLGFGLGDFAIGLEEGERLLNLSENNND